MANNTMTAGEPSPYFSVIISTRNRPVLFEQALQSVAGQSFSNVEIIVVVDGSDSEHLENYALLESSYPNSQFHYLVHRPNGHGQSYAMNYGAAQSQARYLCFLDDDDYWTDDDYLARTYRSLTHSEQPVDVHYSNQRAFFANGARQEEDVWLEDLIPHLQQARANIEDSYFVDAKFILRSNGFGHLNCSIFAREFYESIGGMDETIRYENDRDVFIRAVDRASTILYSSHFVSRHNIPDAKKRDNMSTVASDIDKKLYQLRVYDKGICMSQQRCVKDHSRRGKIYELKHIVQILAKSDDIDGAAFYARAALLGGFNLRWLVYTLYLSLKSLFR